ncbi:MAG TPA: toprim domain-containing protein, partial [Ktedonobacteraceae bacterium]|nr:toprim domain-containing protein [Ktedonobacteraceae bacterium]
MRTDYSQPSRSLQSRRSVSNRPQDEPEEEKPVDYSHLDIITEAERIIERRLVRHTRTSGKWHCACPFPDCTSKNDAFTVWDRPVLEERRDGKREVHFWCGRCGRMGSLISLLRQYREAMTGEQLSWPEAAQALRIDPRTKRTMDEDVQNRSRQMTASDKRLHLDEQRRKAGQAELAILDALYHRARAWLAAGQIVMKDGRCIALDQPQAYLLSRGYTLDQANMLGIAYIPTVQEVPELTHLVARSWRGRILFPLAGPHGVSGYAGRTLWRWTPGMEPEQHKQLLDDWNASHPDPAKRILRHNKTYLPAYYGYQDACHASTLVLVEGEFDAASVRLALSGLPDMAVCAFGKNVQARLVPENVLHVVLALDLDQAGQQALERLIDELQSRGMTVSVARSPVGKDWNDCHRLAGLEAIREEMAHACDVSPAREPLLVSPILAVPIAGLRP